MMSHDPLWVQLGELARIASRGKHHAGLVARFLLDTDSACAELAAAMTGRTYQPHSGRAFWTFDPKRVRYCDDMLIYHDDPGRLRTVLVELTERAARLRLRLH